MAGRSGLLCAAVVLFAVASCRKPEPAGPVHFAREEIAMDVRPGTLEACGMYQCR